MLYLWIFGNNVEDSMGHQRFVVFYLACGVIAALGQSLLNPESKIPMIGASAPSPVDDSCRSNHRLSVCKIGDLSPLRAPFSRR